MGNALPSCCTSKPESWVKLVFWEGTTKFLTGDRLAGEVMFEYPDRLVCHAGSFYIGQPIPVLAIDDKLIKGETYFVLPIDRFACTKMFSASSIAAFDSSPKPAPINFGNCPLQYIKGANGRVLIKVCPEFILKIIFRGKDQGCNSPTNRFLCSTPELQKHYEQLVGSKEQTWSPRLDTISEFRNTTATKITCSPIRLFRLEKKSEELEGQLIDL